MIEQLLMIVGLVMTPRAAAREPTVVFVCEHGAAKSVIATTYINKIAAERGLRARAVNRGVNPQTDLSVSALQGLRDDGPSVADQKPSPITQTDVDAATVMFVIGCTRRRTERPQAKRTRGTTCQRTRDTHAATRDAIKRYVERLIDDLVKKQRSQ